MTYAESLYMAKEIEPAAMESKSGTATEMPKLGILCMRTSQRWADKLAVAQKKGERTMMTYAESLYMAKETEPAAVESESGSGQRKAW